MFKVGKQLSRAPVRKPCGSFRKLAEKSFSISSFTISPHTVAKAAVEATRLGVKMFNVHASGSLEMMRATVKEVQPRFAVREAAASRSCWPSLF
mgnify:CR=1 FL=1